MFASQVRPVRTPGFEKDVSMSKSGHDFSVGDHVVYPAHGVGQVQGIEVQEVAGLKLEVYVITFDHEKMTLRVPTAKARTAGLRNLAETNVVSQALTTLKGRARSSAPCGRVAPRSTKPRSTPAT